jgi:hypothetical protein
VQESLKLSFLFGRIKGAGWCVALRRRSEGTFFVEVACMHTKNGIFQQAKKTWQKSSNEGSFLVHSHHTETETVIL